MWPAGVLVAAGSFCRGVYLSWEGSRLYLDRERRAQHCYAGTAGRLREQEATGKQEMEASAPDVVAGEDHRGEVPLHQGAPGQGA